MLVSVMALSWDVGSIITNSMPGVDLNMRHPRMKGFDERIQGSC